MIFQKFFNKFKQILVVEDDSALRKVITDRLREEGYRVAEAKDGGEGVRLAIELYPHLILLDLMLPSLDGIQALKEIRSNERNKATPVIILTNLMATDELKNTALQYGVRAFFEKVHLKMDELILRIRQEAR